MTPEQQRIKIAEACGWKRPSPPFHLIDAQMAQPLDYPNDLNAMHEAVATLDLESYERYLYHLSQVYDRDTPLNVPIFRGATEATAAQRAEAFLRAKGLWEEV